MARIENLERENKRLREMSLENNETIRELREDKGILKKHYKAQTRRIQKIKKKLKNERKLRVKETEKVERERKLTAKERECTKRERKLTAKEREYTKQEKDQKERVIKEKDDILKE